VVSFDNLPQDLLLRAVKKHAPEQWIVLYIERWLKAPVQEEDGRLVPREGGRVPARSAGRSPRAYSADHVEASSEHGGTAAEVREKQWTNHGSDRDRRVERVSRRCKKAWLSRAPKAAHCKSTFPIRLIACSSQSSRKLTIFWSPRGSAPSAGV